MIIGVPKETKTEEYRVGMIPPGVRLLVDHGHTVLVEKGAGNGCRISDEEYAVAGAAIVGGPGDVYGRADMIVKVKEPQPQEYTLLRKGQILYAYLHLAPAPELAKALLDQEVIAIAYETIQVEDGSLPLLIPMSEVAGRMAVQVGAHFLEEPQGGRGVLLGGVPGVRRGKVTVLGAGTAGAAAAKIAVGMGAEVAVVDINRRRLMYLDDIFGGRVTTIICTPETVAESVTGSHLVVGSVLIPGDRAPKIVTRDMVRAMKSGTVIVDVAIDQGGCVETSRPTTHSAPTFVKDEVIHYCVTNMPGAVARTSTFALAGVTLPYAIKLADEGLYKAVASDAALARGVNLFQGQVTHPNVASALGYIYSPLGELT